MRIASVQEAKRIDTRSQAERGLDAAVLMEAAGSLAAHEIRQSYFSELRRGSVLVVCGPGHNGGDGLVVARHLKSAGAAVEVVMLGEEESRAALTKIQAERAFSSGVVEVEPQLLGASLDRAALVVDAIFGIGLSREVKGLFASAIDSMNACGAPVVSLDSPSGLDCDRGVVLGRAVKADLTMTFGIAKRGFFVNDGPRSIGRLRVLSIGFPRDLVVEEASTHRLVSGNTARMLLPRRRNSGNKSTHGRAAIVAGRKGMFGALIIASLGAGRAGAGYVYAVSHADPSTIVNQTPEFLTLTTDELFDDRKIDAFGVGPGLGTGEETKKLIRELHERKISSVVLDADALTVLASERLSLLRTWILTPHAGELGKLMGVSAAEIEADRYRYAEEAAKKFGCIVLLKGFRTVVSDGSRTAVVSSGNVALAKAGAGDVLTGMITGFLAQGKRPFPAACLAAYLHGRLADVWTKSGRDVISLEPSDLTEALPHLIRRIREGGDA